MLWAVMLSANIWALTDISTTSSLSLIPSGGVPQIPPVIPIRQNQVRLGKHPEALGKLYVYLELFCHWREHRPKGVLSLQLWNSLVGGWCSSVKLGLSPSNIFLFVLCSPDRGFSLHPVSRIFIMVFCLWIVVSWSSCESEIRTELCNRHDNALAMDIPILYTNILYDQTQPFLFIFVCFLFLTDQLL